MNWHTTMSLLACHEILATNLAGLGDCRRCWQQREWWSY